MGREYKQLIRLFSDPTYFGRSLLEEVNSIVIDDDPNVKLSEFCLLCVVQTTDPSNWSYL